MIESILVLQIVILVAFLATQAIGVIFGINEDFGGFIGAFLDRPTPSKEYSLGMNIFGCVALVFWWLLMPVTWVVYTKILYRDEQ